MLVSDGIPAERTITVHEGIDVEHVAAAEPVNLHELFWLPHQAPVVGNVAALVPHKGQRYLVDAAHLVVQEVPDARFVILGEGELREHLEQQIREYRLEKHVLLAGFRTDVIGCMKGFDLFVMSSVTEGLGTSLLDAMACGRAIVATDTGGIPEVVEDASPECSCLPAIPARWPRPSSRCSRTRGNAGRWVTPASRASGRASPSSGWSPRPRRFTRARPADPT